MYFIAGMVRSTMLYFFAVSLVSNGSYSFQYGGLYIILSLIHIGLCKLTKASQSTGDIFIGAFEHDIIAPFLRIKTLIAVLTKKHIIQDTPAHAVVDKAQVYSGGVWGILMLLYVISSLRTVL